MFEWTYLEDAVSKNARMNLLRELPRARLHSSNDLVSLYQGARLYFVATRPSVFNSLIETKLQRKGRVLLLSKTDEPTLEFLREKFEVVFAPSPQRVMLKKEQLLEVLEDKHPEHFIIGGSVSKSTRVVMLYKGNLDVVIVSFDWFTSYSQNGPKADFSKLSIQEYGQTIRLGRFEATTDAILYEFDGAYRRMLIASRRKEEQSLGASIRRLRLQKGLRQEDFQPNISRKEISRIENGLVLPRSETLEILAKRLEVGIDQIREY